LPIVGLPVLDMALVIVSRRRRGAPVLTGGRDHTTHRLLAWVGTPRAVAAVLGASQLVLCLTGIAVLQLEQGEMLAATAFLLLLGGAAVAVLEQPGLLLRRQES